MPVPEQFFFPHGFTRRAEPAPGSLDEIRICDNLMRPLTDLVPGVAPVGASVWVRGWAVDPSEQPERIAKAVIIGIGDRRYFEAGVRNARPDVALDRKNRDLKHAGFTGTISLAGMQPGRYAITVNVLAADGKQYFEVPSTRVLEIVSSRYLFPNAVEDRSGQIAAGVSSIEPMRVRPAHREHQFDRSEVIVVRGNAFDRGTSSRSGGVFAVIDDYHYVGGVTGLPNPDLQHERSAYAIRIAARDLSPGPHSLRVVALSGDSKTYASTPTTQIEILPAGQ